MADRKLMVFLAVVKARKEILIKLLYATSFLIKIAARASGPFIFSIEMRSFCFMLNTSV